MRYALLLELYVSTLGGMAKHPRMISSVTLRFLWCDLIWFDDLFWYKHHLIGRCTKDEQSSKAWRGTFWDLEVNQDIHLQGIGGIRGRNQSTLHQNLNEVFVVKLVPCKPRPL
mmetsp:Transcript_15177/g.31282  ORF Transcript_15177/g.31282 Transcript_15177/m.31282 type:complete len:113 (+) Transcript_15177:165-503(+)